MHAKKPCNLSSCLVHCFFPLQYIKGLARQNCIVGISEYEKERKSYIFLTPGDYDKDH